MSDKDFNVVIFRGLGGQSTSYGMDILAEGLRKLPNVDYVVLFSYKDVNRAVQLISQFKDRTILGGNSFGVGAFLQVAKALPNVKFPYAFSFDPSQYWWGGHTMTPNIDRLVNFWQDAPLWFIGNQQITGAENIHVDDTHINMDDRLDLHKRVISDVRNVK